MITTFKIIIFMIMYMYTYMNKIIRTIYVLFLQKKVPKKVV